MNNNLSFLSLSAAILAGVVTAIVAPAQSGTRALAAHEAERHALAATSTLTAQPSNAHSLQATSSLAQSKKIHSLRRSHLHIRILTLSR